MATENTDTVTIADTLQVKNKIISPSFKDGFPDSVSRKDTLFVKPINMLPVMEVPSGKTSLSYWDTPLKSHGIMILLLLVFRGLDLLDLDLAYEGIRFQRHECRRGLRWYLRS